MNAAPAAVSSGMRMLGMAAAGPLSHLAPAFSSWRGFCEWKVHSRTVLMRMLSTQASLALNEAFYSWTRVAETGWAERLEAARRHIPRKEGPQGPQQPDPEERKREATAVFQRVDTAGAQGAVDGIEQG